MGACGCNKTHTAEEDYFEHFWNSLQIKSFTAEELLAKTQQIKSNTKEDFFKVFEENIVKAYFESEIHKTVGDYLFQNSLGINSPFKCFAVFFSLLLVCDCKTEKNFLEASKKFYQMCIEFADVSIFNVDDKYLVKEFVLFYVYLVSAQTHKAFLNSPNAPFFEKSRNEFNSIFSQRNRDVFVESLFVYYQRNEFSLLSFVSENFKKLQHADVRNSLEEIEKKNVDAAIGGKI
jgi:hypothetical protein